MEEYYLEPVMTGRRTFNNLATVRVLGNGDKHLLSYEYHIATVYANGKAEILDIHSHTITAHIREFFMQEGLEVKKSKDWLNKTYMKDPY